MFILWVTFAEFILDHYRHYKEHAVPAQILILLSSTIFIVVDVIYNIIIGTIYFRQLPTKKTLTLTQRLRKILKEEPVESWRWEHAYFICKYLISPWDFNHCRMGLGRE